jgi:hypothetical protein
MKKDIIIAVLILVLGFVLGLICRPEHFRDVTKMIQTDTVVRYEKVKYTPLELKGKTIQLDVPKISALSMVYLPYDSTMVVYRDCVRYISLPRQYYYTSTENAEVWHSGIDSTIDSLNVVAKNVVISKTETTTQNPSPWRYEVTVGLDYGMMWEKYITPNVGAEIGYRKLTLGVECGVHMNLENSIIVTPMPYLQASIKYRLAGR